MSRAAVPRPRDRAIHLWVLVGFALAQPLFDLLGENAAFFAVRGSTKTEIVLFALAVTLLPAAALVGVSALVGRLSGRAGAALQYALVGFLAAIIALEAIQKLDGPGDRAVLAASAAVGVAFATLYATTRALPLFLTALGPAPLVFLGLFLFASPVSELVLASETRVRTETVRSTTPVVMIVFDELSTASLLDRRQHIDRGRFPNFAALARGSTWYRASTTVHAHTEYAVPAILDGRVPHKGRLPILRDHPHNLFTLLGGHHRMRVFETLTHLCPRRVCRRGGSPGVAAQPATDRVSSLASDVGIVYLHVLLPQGLERRVPPISDTWMNFGKREAEDESAGTRDGYLPVCTRRVCDLARVIEPSTRPTLYFLHSLLPHVTWAYLPSGRRYGNNVRLIPGIERARWRRDEWLTTQGYQRYLLQLGYTDRSLGMIMRKLRATGVYDRALVVVTADHGVGFVPGEPRRLVTSANLHQIAFQPLFLKLPHQRRARIDDSFARTIDILPTIADALRVTVPWRMDGRSLLRRAPRTGEVRVGTAAGGTVSADLEALLARRRADVRARARQFGTGGWPAVYRVGPNSALVGRRLSHLHVIRAAGVSARVDGADLLRAVDPRSPLMPVYLTGTLSTDEPGTHDVAFALDGRVVAVARTYEDAGRERFQAFLPEGKLRRGRNELAVFVVRSDGRGRVLRQVSGRGSFAVRGTDGSRLVSTSGEWMRIDPAAIAGTVGLTRTADTVRIRGWAVDRRRRAAAEGVVVFVGPSSVYFGTAHNFPSAVAAKRFSVERAGFSFELPAALLPGRASQERIRVYAIAGKLASELRLRGERAAARRAERP